VILFLTFTAASWGRLVGAENPHARWEQDIQAFEAADRTNPPPAHCIVFVGSSSIRVWKTLGEDFKGLPVVNRGFGGSEMGDSAYYADRIVVPYRPRQVFVYAGDNDLAGGKSPQQVLADFKAFVTKVQHALPETSIAFISIKPSPSRWKLSDQMRAANQLIRQFAATDQRLAFVDVFTPMLDSDGKPRAELFQADQLHLNSKGYALWTSLVRPYLALK
jgi:lysophospholipase L1-like esterase